MVFESRVTWQKLELELDLLSTEDPHSLLPILLGLNSLLWPEEPADSLETVRELNYLSFELASQCKDQSEQQRFEKLNHFFFQNKGFQVLSPCSEGFEEEALLPRSILLQRQGAPLPLSLIYLHLASHIDLPINLVQAQPQCLLKWVRRGKSHYMDLSQEGRTLSDTDLCQWLNRYWGNKSPCDKDLEVLPARRVLYLYLKDLEQYYESKQMWNQLHTLFNVLLKLDPHQAQTLCRRALLLKKLGYAKEALCDLKQYFSFVEVHQAPAELQKALYELENMSDESIPPHIDLLH